MRELTGARHAVAVQSGTGALHVAYRLAGVRFGRELVFELGAELEHVALLFVTTIDRQDDHVRGRQLWRQHEAIIIAVGHDEAADKARRYAPGSCPAEHFLAVLVLVGGAAAQEQVLNVGKYGQVATYDPHAGGLDTMWWTLNNFYESLVDMNEDIATLRPVLATSWTISRDGKVYTFTLRPGVKFNDGTPFDAAAVKANVERAQALKKAAFLYVKPVVKVETPAFWWIAGLALIALVFVGLWWVFRTYGRR